MTSHGKQPKSGARVMVSKGGPYLVSGSVALAKQTIATDREGGSESWEQGKAYPVQATYALCRCGASKNKPFCDGSHNTMHFDGSETTSREPYLKQSQVMEGPGMLLTDVQGLCAFARFCDTHGQVWNQVEHTDKANVRANFIRQVGNCPSGRLVAWDKVKENAVEPELPISIGLIEDPQQQCSGPLWLRGGIPVVSADGFEYEVRNRVTLCRCGQSQNKPFCDGSHAAVKFRDD
ncbi:MAG TPA: CDGSH iron-sulfur domain-containing protein [Gammaproteobacteria bacterium]|nr:CDGSH iron-sulfur domain-containing protein [Gammaproteobacteria bacterium]